MRLSGVPRARLSSVVVVIALVIAGAIVVAGASARERAHHCRPFVSVKYQSRDRVSAAGTSCRAARKLVRTWDSDASAGRIPDRILGGGVNKKGVIVWGKWSPRYDWRGHVCRWASLKPKVVKPPAGSNQPASALPRGRGRCRSGAKLVEWTYHFASNPTIGNVRGCNGSFGFQHGAVYEIRAKHLTCRKGKHVIRAAIHDRVIGPEHHQLGVLHRHALGFTWIAGSTIGNFRAARGHARLTFHLCWFSLNC